VATSYLFTLQITPRKNEMQPKERTLVYLTEKDELIQDLDKVIYKR